MEPHVKLRVMLAVLGVKRAEEQKELWDAFSHLLTTATEDTDDWCFPTHIIPITNTHDPHRHAGHSPTCGWIIHSQLCERSDLAGVSSPFLALCTFPIRRRRVSVMALVIKGITPQGGSSEATHSAYAGCCAEIRKLLAALPPGALSDLPPLDSLYISGPNPNGEGGPQCRNPHFVDRAPFVPTEYGLGSVTAAAASGAANEPQHKEVKKAPTLTAGLARTGLAKASTPRSRDGMGGSWGGGGSTEGRERKVVVEEAEEDDEGGFHEVAGAGGGKRRRGKGGGEPKAKRGRKPAADAVPQPAQTHAGEEEEDDDGGNSGPAPFGEDSSTSHMANLPPAGYSDTSGGGGGGGGGGSPPAEAPVDPWSNFAPAPPAPAPAPPPVSTRASRLPNTMKGSSALTETEADFFFHRAPLFSTPDGARGAYFGLADGLSWTQVQAKPEGMSEWTGKLKSISGLLELVRTSKMSEGEITGLYVRVCSHALIQKAHSVSQDDVCSP
jgi:hypothetical protein